jgi:hypothetical protein
MDQRGDSDNMVNNLRGLLFEASAKVPTFLPLHFCTHTCTAQIHTYIVCMCKRVRMHTYLHVTSKCFSVTMTCHWCKVLMQHHSSCFYMCTRGL